MLNFIFFTLLLISCSWAHEYLETKTLVDVYNKASELRLKYGAKNVLVVFDIDNTLLRANQPLGSDQWFEWQAEAIKQSSSEASFRTFDELLKAQADFFQLGSMSLTEQSIPQIITALKKYGHPIISLTSRGPDLRNVTERDLEKNQLWFGDSSILAGVPNQFIEFPFKNRVSFMNGIFMTTGHHKGEALVYLLKKAGKNFKAIIFADDHERHTRRVYDTFANSQSLEMITFRYAKEDENVSAFKQGPKSMVLSQTRYLLLATQQVFKNARAY
jgi:hypothetical protein